MDDSTDPTPDQGPFSRLGLRGGAEVAEPVPVASDVGTLLCATRMRVGKDLQQIAALLHIRYNYLVAIEDGRFEDLPGQAYALGFVRAYAEHLGLDGDEVVRRYKDENSGLRRKASLDFPVPTPESGVPSGALLAVAVVMGMVVYGVWYSFAGADRRAADLIQEVPARLANLLGTEQPGAASDTISPVAVAEPQERAGIDQDAAAEAPSEGTKPGDTADVPPQQIAALEQAAEPAAPVPDNNTAQSERASSESEETQTPPPAAPTDGPQAVETAKVAETSQPVVELRTSTPQETAPKVSNPPAEAAPATGVSAAPDKPVVAASDTTVPATTDKPVVTADATLTRNETKPAPTAAPPVSAKPSQPAESKPAATDIPPATGAESVAKAAAVAPSPPKTPAVSEPAAASKPVTAPKPEVLPNVETPAEPVKVADIIELRAKSDSWIQVRSGDQLLLTRLLRRGETYRVPDRKGLTLMTGNAGGLEVLVNNKVLPPLGGEGSVARGVPLDAARLLTMAKAAEPPAGGGPSPNE